MSGLSREGDILFTILISYNHIAIFKPTVIFGNFLFMYYLSYIERQVALALMSVDFSFSLSCQSPKIAPIGNQFAVATSKNIRQLQ
jgi:hypothetical protein